MFAPQSTEMTIARYAFNGILFIRGRFWWYTSDGYPQHRPCDRIVCNHSVLLENYRRHVFIWIDNPNDL